MEPTNNISKILKSVKDDLYDNNHKSKSFFQTSILHLAISLEIAISTYNKNDVSYEKLCESIPKKFGSRSTIQSILNDAVELKYFYKETSSNDKRIKNYRLTDEYSEMLRGWAEYFENALKKTN